MMFNFSALAALFLVLIMVNSGCQKNASAPASANQNSVELKTTNNWTQVNLDADASQYNPAHIDPSLVNAWGLAISDEGEVWVSSNGGDVATVYNGDGQTLEPAIAIPGGAPTGAIYNPTLSFIVPATGVKAEFIYCTESGTIVAAESGVAYTVADGSGWGAVYKGLTFARINGKPYLYATDFHNGAIDVFDGQFQYMSNISFVDPNLPSGYAPFNIRNFDGSLFVTYAKQIPPENIDDEKGPGHGYVDIYNTDGSFVQRYVSQGELNSPWGLEKISGQGGGMLIGNFGNGKINMYDMNGNFIKPLKSGGEPIKIDGLWSILRPGQNLPASQQNRLYFTSGPDGEAHGIFGYLTQN